MPNLDSEPCGLGTALATISGKWKPEIIWRLHEGTKRFGALRRVVSGISERVLTRQLRELELDGVVERAVFQEAVLRVEYSLTPAGAELNAAVHALSEWGQQRRHRDLVIQLTTTNF